MLSSLFFRGRALRAYRGALPIRSFSSENKRDESCTYENFKKVAHQSGDAAKEWMSGSSTSGSEIYKQANRDNEECFDTMKRKLDMGESKHEKEESVEDGKKHFTDKPTHEEESLQEQAKSNLKKGMKKAEEVLHKAKETITRHDNTVGMKSARATWRETRSKDKKKKEQASRKSQLTDEAFGDNPKESTPRKEKQITESEQVGD